MNLPVLHNIENAFECEIVCNSTDDYDANAASVMYSNVDNPETRLRLIMENIITNKGDFEIPTLDELNSDQLDALAEKGESYFLEDLDQETLLAAIKANQSKLDGLDTEDLVEIFRLLVGLEG